MYHSVSRVMLGGSHPYFETTTTPEVFSEHMKYLDENGYTVLSLSEAVRMIKGEVEMSPKSVVITFDDGLRDFLENAYPVLAKYRFPSTVFLPTGFIGEKNLKFMRWECLSWGEVRMLHEKGVVFGSHTVSHQKLSELGGETVAAQFRDSKEAIERETRSAVDTFSYPYAFPVGQTRLIAELSKSLIEAGYTNGVTTKIGRCSIGDEPLILKRIPVNEYDDLGLLQAKLKGGYDWLGSVQFLWKCIRSISNRKRGIAL